MLKIGEFARLCHVNTQTIRYYDSMGILPADRVDTFTGYRYYHPDKLEIFRSIRLYQDIGFSLEEIKILLSNTPADIERRTLLMSERRRVLNREMDALRGKLAQLEKLSRERERRGESDWLTVFSAEFEDDPAVLGRWELVARLAPPLSPDGKELSPKELSPESPRVAIESTEEIFRHMVFLPEGRAWYAFMWSRGVIRFICQAYRTVIPFPYALWEREDGRYMTVRFYLPHVHIENPIWLLYRQTEHRALTELESHTMRDDTDLPIRPDPAVVGEWETVDFVADPATFTPEAPQTARAYLWPTALSMTDRNISIRRLSGEHGGRDEQRIYTSTGESGTGAILAPAYGIAEHYRLRHIEEDDYLFVEHKSGDYIFGGIPPQWYVYRRLKR